MPHFPINQSVPLWSWPWPCLSNHLTAPPMECLAVICPWLHLGCPSGRTQEVQQPPDRLYLWEQERRDMGNYRLLCSRRPPFREFRWVPHLGHGNCHFPPICPPVFRKKIFFFLGPMLPHRPSGQSLSLLFLRVWHVLGSLSPSGRWDQTIPQRLGMNWRLSIAQPSGEVRD